MNNKEFLLDKSKWPHSEIGRFCCLVKRGTRECAFILACDQDKSGKVAVSFGNIFSGGTGGLKVYDSVDAILEDGWVVD